MATSNSLFFKLLIGAGSNVDATSYAMASTAPVNGQIHFACVVSLKATTPDTPTLSGTAGFNGAWTQIGSTVTLQTPAGNFIGVSWFWSLASSASAGVITANYTNTQLGSVWAVVTSALINTTTPAVQSGSSTDTTASTALPAVTLSALSAAVNWVLIAEAQNTTTQTSLQLGTAAYSPQAVGSFTLTTSDGIGLRILLVAGNAHTPPSSTWTASVAKITYGVEVAQDGTGATSGGIVQSGAAMGGNLQ